MVPRECPLSLRKVPAALYAVKCPGHNVLSPGRVPATQHPGDSPWDVLPDILQGVWCIVPRPRGRFPLPCIPERCSMSHPWGRSTEHDAQHRSGSPVHHTLSLGTVPSALHPWRRSSGRDARHPQGARLSCPVPGDGPRCPASPGTVPGARCPTPCGTPTESRRIPGAVTRIPGGSRCAPVPPAPTSLAAADLPQLGRPLALPAGQEPVAAAEANGEGQLPHGRVPRQLPLAVGRPLRHGGGGGGPAAAAAPRQPPGARGPRARGSGAAGAGQPPRHIPARPALLAAPRLRRRLRRRRR